MQITRGYSGLIDNESKVTHNSFSYMRWISIDEILLLQTYILGINCILAGHEYELHSRKLFASNRALNAANIYKKRWLRVSDSLEVNATTCKVCLSASWLAENNCHVLHLQWGYNCIPSKSSFWLVDSVPILWRHYIVPCLPIWLVSHWTFLIFFADGKL